MSEKRVCCRCGKKIDTLGRPFCSPCLQLWSARRRRAWAMVEGQLGKLHKRHKVKCEVCGSTYVRVEKPTNEFLDVFTKDVDAAEAFLAMADDGVLTK